MPVDLSLPAETTPTRRNFRVVALIVAAGLMMEHLDSTALATALPTMARTFDVSPLHMSVALTSYLLSLAIFIPASGKVADRFGARTVFCAAIGLFTLGSILCAQASSLGFLVAARLIQGLGGAMMVPVGRLVLLRSVAKSDLVAAMAWFLVPAFIGPVLGPPVGGLIVTYLNWRWIFYLNIPIGIMGIAAALAFIDNFKEPARDRFDIRGFVLSGISLACLVFGLETFSRGAASPGTAGALVGIGLVFGIAYMRHARHHPAPILDLGLMRVQTFGLSVWGGSCTRITAGALPFLLPMMMQLGFGFSAAASGAITFAFAAGSMLMKATATPILRRFGFRTTLIWTTVIATLLLAICAGFRPGWPLWSIYAVLLFGGFFQSLLFTAYNTVAYAEIPKERMSAAISFYTTFQQLVLSLGICVSAGALQASIALSGHTRAAFSDFSVAFLVVTAVSMLGAPISALFPKSAGDDMSGHKSAP